MAWQPATLIAAKRDGGELQPADVQRFIDEYLADHVDDAQMAAWLMAGVINGFSTAEAVALTDALVASGDQIDLSALRGPTVDKHSTGGVGDVTTLVVAPLLAAAGCQVAKLSGRGLGHTGGTLDKLEAIPGMRVDLSPAQIQTQVEEIGIAVASATSDLVPADKRLYALRDVTATVPSVALIASSVMSKKIAGGAGHILLDVKTGDGAFMEDVDAAIALAELCVEIGEQRGRRTAAIISDMSQPLGDGIGNAVEVAVAVETLQGQRADRFRDLCVVLAARALELTGVPRDEATGHIEHLLESGEALATFRQFVVAQGGDGRVADDPRAVLPRAPVVADWTPRSGIVETMRCRALGELAGSLGAGRARAGDVIDPAVGIEIFVRVGDEISSGQAAATIHAASDSDAQRALDAMDELVSVGSTQVEAPRLVAAEVGLERSS